MGSSSAPTSPTSIHKPKLPVAQLFILSICRFAEPVALTGVFPYLPEMIESFDIPHNEVAKWAGITSAVFSVSQCLTAIPWGRASDKYGRKPIILLAMSCAMGSSLFFGFSRSLRWAIVARALSGASNGNVGILRTTVAEMVPQKSLQPRAFSTLPLIWQVGSIVGPMIGGALASPATTMPQIFGQNKFLKKFPFALPNLVSGVVFTFGLIVGFLFLKESNEAKKYRRDYGRIIGRYLTRSCMRRKAHDINDEDDPEALFTSRKSAAGHKSEVSTAPRYRDVFSPQSNLNLLTYCILALHGVAYDQLLPVLMHLPVDRKGISLPLHFSGGFGLESGRIGLLFMVYGIFSMVAQFTLFPYVTQRLGALYCMRACTFVFPIVYLITPYTVLMPTSTTQQAAMLGVMLFKALANVFAFPCITILMTNSAKSLKLLGTLNGVATSLSALGRAAGPYLAGRTFTWGVSAGYGVAAWWLLAVFAVAGHVVTWWLVEMDGFGGAEEKVEASEEVSEMIRLDTRGPVVTRSGVDIEPRASGDGVDELEGLLEESEEEDDADRVEKAPLLAGSQKY